MLGGLAEGEAHYFAGVMYQSRDRVVNGKMRRKIPALKTRGRGTRRRTEGLSGRPCDFDFFGDLGMEPTIEEGQRRQQRDSRNYNVDDPVADAG